MSKRIDVHTHALSDAVIGALPARGFKLTGGYQIPVRWSPDAALAYMDRHEIAAQVVSMPILMRVVLMSILVMQAMSMLILMRVVLISILVMQAMSMPILMRVVLMSILAIQAVLMLILIWVVPTSILAMQVVLMLILMRVVPMSHDLLN